MSVRRAGAGAAIRRERTAYGLFLLLIALSVLWRLLFTDLVEAGNDVDRNAIRAVALLHSWDVISRGPSVGIFSAELDHGPFYYLLLTPGMALSRSLDAIIWTHALVCGLGLWALGRVAHARSGSAVTMGILGGLLVASGAWARSVEEIWHPGLTVALVFMLAWAMRRLLERPTGLRLFAVLGLTAASCQVYLAAAVQVPLTLVVTGVAVSRPPRMPLGRALGAVVWAAVIAMPFGLRLILTLPSPEPNAAVFHPNTAAFLTEMWHQIDGSATWLGRLPTAVAVVSLGLLGLPRALRDGYGRFVVGQLCVGVLASAWAYGHQAAPRYLNPTVPWFFLLAAEGLAQLVVWSRRLPRPTWRGALGLLTVALIVTASAVPLTPRPAFGDPRLGADNRLGVGEQQRILAQLHKDYDWGLPALLRRAHGTLTGHDHAVVFQTAFWPRGAPDASAHVLVTRQGSAVSVPTRRRRATTTLRGAFGRALQLIRFQPAVAYGQVTVDMGHRRCRLRVPFQDIPSYQSWPEGSALNLPSWSDDCAAGPAGEMITVFVPVLQPSGRLQVLVKRRVSPPMPDPPVPGAVLATGPTDSPWEVWSVSWAPPTRYLELRFDAGYGLTHLDIY